MKRTACRSGFITRAAGLILGKVGFEIVVNFPFNAQIHLSGLISAEVSLSNGKTYCERPSLSRTAASSR